MFEWVLEKPYVALYMINHVTYLQPSTNNLHTFVIDVHDTNVTYNEKALRTVKEEHLPYYWNF